MAKIIYDTGEMLVAARNMEKELDRFKKNRKKLSKRIGDTRKHTDDPIVRSMIDQYDKTTEKDIQKFEKNMEGYISTMRSAAKKVATVVRSLNV